MITEVLGKTFKIVLLEDYQKLEENMLALEYENHTKDTQIKKLEKELGEVRERLQGLSQEFSELEEKHEKLYDEYLAKKQLAENFECLTKDYRMHVGRLIGKHNDGSGDFGETKDLSDHTHPFTDVEWKAFTGKYGQ